MTNIALIGPSGVGKGTHAAELLSDHNLLHIATGKLLRAETEQHSAVGFLARRHIDQGMLVPDEVVDAVIASKIWHADDSHDGFLFDGVPRTLDQALFLDELMSGRDSALDGVIYLEIDDDAVASRLLGRLICDECHSPFHIAFRPPATPGKCDHCGGSLSARDDDIKEMISVRLRAFRRSVDPVLAYYAHSDRLHSIDGNHEIGEVSAEIRRVMTSLRSPESASRASPHDSGAAFPHADVIQSIRTTSTATHESFDLVLIGGPGSGKGTQSEQLESHLGLLHIASGDLFRDNLANHTDLGNLAKRYMDRGALVPDDVTEAMVEERINRSDAESGFILDGFPRNVAQAEALTQMMNAASRRVDGVLYIRVSDDEIVRRLSGRLICRECQTPFHVDFKPPEKAGFCDTCGGDLYQRDDDNARTISKRLKTFHSQNGPILNYYQGEGLLVEIDGEGDVDQVTRRSLNTADRLREQQAN